MKKSILFKKSVLIISITLILGLLTGCAIIIPGGGQTGTVYINITNSDWRYEIYLDSYSSFFPLPYNELISTGKDLEKIIHTTML